LASILISTGCRSVDVDSSTVAFGLHENASTTIKNKNISCLIFFKRLDGKDIK